jgi:hypothetical protein
MMPLAHVGVQGDLLFPDPGLLHQRDGPAQGDEVRIVGGQAGDRAADAQRLGHRKVHARQSRANEARKRRAPVNGNDGTPPETTLADWLM